MSKQVYAVADDCIAYARCVPPVAQAGKWWCYTLVTSSGRNKASGYTSGEESEVSKRLRKLLQRMEHNENPYRKARLTKAARIQLTGEQWWKTTNC